MKENVLHRNCPKCHDTIIYKTVKTFKNASLHNTTCRKCCSKDNSQRMTNTNKKLWKDEDFKKRRGKAVTARRVEYWKIPENRTKMGMKTSARNKERWKDETYRAFMYDKLRLNSIRGICGSFLGHHFRSSLELYYMIEILTKQNIPIISCEKEKCEIKYEFENKSHY